MLHPVVTERLEGKLKDVLTLYLGFVYGWVAPTKIGLIQAKLASK